MYIYIMGYIMTLSHHGNALKPRHFNGGSDSKRGICPGPQNLGHQDCERLQFVSC